MSGGRRLRMLRGQFIAKRKEFVAQTCPVHSPKAPETYFSHLVVSKVSNTSRIHFVRRKVGDSVGPGGIRGSDKVKMCCFYRILPARMFASPRARFRAVDVRQRGVSKHQSSFPNVLVSAGLASNIAEDSQDAHKTPKSPHQAHPNAASGVETHHGRERFSMHDCDELSGDCPRDDLGVKLTQLKHPRWKVRLGIGCCGAAQAALRRIDVPALLERGSRRQLLSMIHPINLVAGGLIKVPVRCLAMTMG
ncbi:hypothetical protein B0J14DRAFT_558792 [Halenospora varia]|nr:hypothetical protein B0J14DRAFT_558792 [Halenospora varia]